MWLQTEKRTLPAIPIGGNYRCVCCSCAPLSYSYAHPAVNKPSVMKDCMPASMAIFSQYETQTGECCLGGMLIMFACPALWGTLVVNVGMPALAGYASQAVRQAAHLLHMQHLTCTQVD
eukprot:355627-Chlamydomonas_euryale.AAC.18